MSSQIQIYLSNSNNFYTPGQEVTGRVECNFANEATINAVLVIFDGRCSTSWIMSQRHRNNMHSRTRMRHVSYTGEEIYFHQEINMMGMSNGSLRLQPGMHSYNFAFRLPEQLPSSHESQTGCGSIRYTIKGVLDKSSAFNNEAVVALNVISPLDLNYVPRMREPVEMSVDTVLCSCFCGNNGPLTFKFTLPTTGYVPGQDVKVGAYVQNLTSTTAQSVKFKIKKTTEYICELPRRLTKYEKEDIAFQTFDGIDAHSEKTWTASLRLPDTILYPNMVPCNLINVTYILKGEVVLPCPHTNLTAFVPLMIGNVQIRDMEFNSLGPPPLGTSNVSTPNYGLLGSLSGPSNYGEKNSLPSAPELLPPSYEEAQQPQKF
ncbi:hypothetical protein FQA39_LY14324 [Lamprigera yunnana]|nr:hypothetical protein FQA39_LY14324 [Lamprigera yunnana]